jgi:hypothetical protein
LRVVTDSNIKKEIRLVEAEDGEYEDEGEHKC